MVTNCFTLFISFVALFTSFRVSASALGGVFGSGGGGGDPLASLLLSALGALVNVAMGLQLLELIRLPLPSLDFRLRAAAVETNGGINGGDSLFDEGGGLVLDNLRSNKDKRANARDEESDELAALLRTCLLGGTSALVASPCATPVLASLLAYLATASSSATASTGDLGRGAALMLSYTLGYSTPLLAVGATGGRLLVELQNARDKDKEKGFTFRALLGQWVTPLTGGILIAFGMNGFLVALLGDPSLAGLAPIIE